MDSKLIKAMAEKKKRKPQIGIEMNETLIADLKQTAKAIQVPYSQIVREALTEKLLEIKETHPFFKLQNN
ncbi:MAG: ribbon-helix-helix domain-containing protein [Acidobacteria bacterium]|nr:ribbon-helix-helix domain-containing protein [Acidobacteriota bacterium]